MVIRIPDSVNVNIKVPILVHCEWAEHDLQPYDRPSEEKFDQGRIASDASGEHVAVDLEVNEAW